MIKCPFCTTESSEYKVLISSHYYAAHQDISPHDYKLAVINYNNIQITYCKTCQKPIVNELHRKRKYCSRECYSPKNKTTKVCKVCGIEKSLSEFYSAKNNTSGVEARCKQCCKKPKKKRVSRPKEKHHKFKSNMRSLMWHQLKNGGYTKDSRTYTMLGISYSDFLLYIQNQFLPGMTWDNYGVCGWTIDHICPINQAVNKDETIKLFHYTNCRPLWHKDNLTKNDLYSIEAEEKCKQLLNRDWIGFKDSSNIKKELILLTGVSGSGKSWILKQINSESVVSIDSDKEPRKDLVLKCWNQDKPVLLALTTQVSSFIKNQSHRFNIKLVVIQDNVENIESNLIGRGGKITTSIKSRIKRMKVLANRKDCIFTGTSSEVLSFFKTSYS